MKKCLVTVGTTKFDDLIAAVYTKRFLKALKDKGIEELLIQTGSSEFSPCNDQPAGLSVTSYKYKPSIVDDINAADLIISHAGAGSCLEIMHAQKPCIVVINDKLMGNHQIELAEQLAKLGHLVYTNPCNLINTLSTFDPDSLTAYEAGKPERFARFLNTIIGIDS